jgi:DNA-directed RNA polymerase specialized sigma24 family protein
MKVKLWKQPRIRGFDRDAFSYSVRGGPRASHKNRLKQRPAWTNDNAEVQKLLLRVFPKLHTDANQERKAARWASVIYLYYFVGHTAADVADQLGIPVQTVLSTLYRIRRAAAGLRTDGKARAAKRGRPTTRIF